MFTGLQPKKSECYPQWVERPARRSLKYKCQVWSCTKELLWGGRWEIPAITWHTPQCAHLSLLGWFSLWEGCVGSFGCTEGSRSAQSAQAPGACVTCRAAAATLSCDPEHWEQLLDLFRGRRNKVPFAERWGKPGRCSGWKHNQPHQRTQISVFFFFFFFFLLNGGLDFQAKGLLLIKGIKSCSCLYQCEYEVVQITSVNLLG